MNEKPAVPSSRQAQRPPDSDADANRSRRSRIPWLVAGLWWLSIVVMLPCGRKVVDALRDRGLLVLAVTVALAAVFVALVAGGWWLRRNRGKGIAGRSVVLALVAGVVVATQLLPRAEERWHVVQYGVLGAMCAVGLRHRGWGGMVLAAATVMAAGWLDEGIQLLLPDRVYDWLDVGLNAIAGVVGVGIVGIEQRMAMRTAESRK